MSILINRLLATGAAGVILAIMTTSAMGAELALVPQPRELAPGKGHFTLSAATPVLYAADQEAAAPIARQLAAAIKSHCGFQPEVRLAADAASGAQIRLALEKESAALGDEGYRLEITPRQVRLIASQPAGLLHGVQTLRQLLPVPPAGTPAKSGKKVRIELPALVISDQPAFGWRGILVDVGRHFHSVAYMKKILDWMALYKMNRLHWHLTEDQGWRIEIKKYPQLTAVGAWRIEPDGRRYGGYYTQDEIRDVVAYAAALHIEVVPEIELPGHCMAALAAYPELSCTGGPFTVQTQWGVFKDVYCAGNEQTFAFLEDVLTEVIALFPYHYLHVGGDEVPRDRWQSCSKCQARKQQEGLEDEAELQSYFIKRVEKFLNAHGRRLIGWDEILEGGLAPGATVQSWRGMEGALAAARSGHDAIVSPGSHTYFNSDIGGLDLRQAYSFNPLPEGLEPERHRHIIGGECCLWSERITEANLDYQLFPRLLALSEVLWTNPAERHYDAFLQRVRAHYPLLAAVGINAGPEARPITLRSGFNPAGNSHIVVLESGEEGSEMRYTLDGTEPAPSSPLYSAPVTLTGPGVIKARAFKGATPYGETASREFSRHLAVGRPAAVRHAHSPHYPAGGEHALVDGVRGSDSFGDGQWQGYEGEDLEVTVDLGEIMPLQRLSTAFMQNTGSWIFLPTFVEWAISRDGEHYKAVAAFDHPTASGTSEIRVQHDSAPLDGRQARFVRLRARSVGLCPAWHPGAGGKAWIFIDEVVVE